MKNMSNSLAVISLTLSAAIFGFFYAWVCSTMWGLDAADPRVAIAAMQAMNASVRNLVFAPGFFGPPLAFALTAAFSFLAGHRAASAAFLTAGVIYLIGGAGLTMTVNVPMNEALAKETVPKSMTAAQALWAAYSAKWQFFNQTRAILSGLAFLVGLYGFWRLRDKSQPTTS
jgi:uncharacterized membrane protein